jgi:dihydrofolate reductase
MQAAYMNSGKEMPGRRYIVVSRNSELDLTGVEMARSPKLAVKIAGELTNSPVIIGGAQLYQALLSDVSRIHYTRINGQYDCDTFFPELDVDEWSETLLQRYSAEDNVVGFDFLTYERIR